MGRSKRYAQAVKLVQKDKAYSVEESIEILKNIPAAKFDETLNVSCKLNVDAKQSDQMVRGSVVLPHGTGKEVKILAFCEPEKEAQAKEAGADYIGSEEVINKIVKEGWLEFDCCVSTPSMMKLVSRLGKVLGPRGLMPSPKTGTVTPNIAHAIGEAKRGKIDFRMDKLACINVGIGKISFSKQALIENAKAFINALIAAKPAAVKADFIRSFYLSTTMSPSLRISL
ncbi:MAG: 50S ribosomal protein L1 [Candidatus Omnitrophota bacterium]|nr:MAG: 50S ribosomal protein L1 [Candidatus Omnitrophota bacterium]